MSDAVSFHVVKIERFAIGGALERGSERGENCVRAEFLPVIRPYEVPTGRLVSAERFRRSYLWLAPERGKFIRLDKVGYVASLARAR